MPRQSGIRRFEEIFAVGAVILGLVMLYWELVISNTVVATHDSIIWYGAFSYFFDCLSRGFLPLWNPYMNCGEPFYFNFYIAHLLDPSLFLFVLIGKIFSINFLALYHCDLIAHYIIFICGCYLFFKHITKYRISAFIGFVTISFSSLATSYLRQHAFILAFYLFPWILLFVLKFLEHQDVRFLLWIAFFLGITLLTYHAMFTISSLAILLICIFLFNRPPKLKFKNVFKGRKDYMAGLSAIFIFVLLVINILPAYLWYTRDIEATVKIIECPGPAPSYKADFLNLLAPHWFILHFFNWGYMSESFLYIGLFGLLFSLIGLVFSRHKYKPGFLSAIIIVIFLMLGNNFLYKMFYKFFPFFSIIRNMCTFGPFFIFCLAYFVCLGCDVIFEAAHTNKAVFYKIPFTAFAVLLCLFALFINRHILNILPLVLPKVHILKGYQSFVVGDKMHYFWSVFENFFYWPYLSLGLFIIGAAVIFYLLFKRPGINAAFKYFVIIFFIFIDLFLFNSIVYGFVTAPRPKMGAPFSGKSVYSNFRIPAIDLIHPFLGFAPAMSRVFTAYSHMLPDITTHFYETNDFFKFANNKRIPQDIKDVFAGVSAPKLRLMHNCAVLPYDSIIKEFEKMEAKEAENVLFIEEVLPLEYAHLNTSLWSPEKENVSPGENIQVVNFSPNEIALKVYAEGDRFLFYSDGYDRAWKAYIDGRQTKIYKANLAFKSVIIEKGRHTVRFVYNPVFYKFCLFCYPAGLLGAFLCLCKKLKRY